MWSYLRPKFNGGIVYRFGRGGVIQTSASIGGGADNRWRSGQRSRRYLLDLVEVCSEQGRLMLVELVAVADLTTGAAVQLFLCLTMAAVVINRGAQEDLQGQVQGTLTCGHVDRLLQ